MVDADEELRAIAQDLLARVHAEGRHEVAAALRTASGRVHTGVHLAASARRPSICAEGVALGAALAAEGVLDVEAIVAVQYKPAGVFRLIAPCGDCRELISDHCPDARVYVWDEGAERAVHALELLPFKTRRRW
jgi:cytidine deaminase